MFTMQIETDNAAFGEGDVRGGDRAAEVARILRRVARLVEDGSVSGPLHDANGNRVGEFELDGGCDHDDE